MEAPLDPARGQEPPKKPRVDPSIVDDLVGRTKKFLGEIAADYIKRPIDELLRWILARALSYLIAAALFITAAVFLMVGGAKGLKEAGVPVWIAYVSLGVVGILAGLIALKSSRPPDKGSCP